MKKKISARVLVLMLSLVWTLLTPLWAVPVQTMAMGTISFNGVTPGTTFTATEDLFLPPGSTNVTGWASAEGMSVSLSVTPAGLGNFSIVAPSNSYNQTFFGTVTVTGTAPDGSALWLTWELVVQTGARVLTPEYPELVIASPTSYTSMTPGQPQMVSVRLQNLSTFRARNIRIHTGTTMVNATTPAGFVVEQVGEPEPFTLNSRQANTFQIQISPNANVAGGAVNIPFQITYENNVGELIRETLHLPVQVVVPPVIESRVVMSDFTIDRYHIASGEGFAITTTLRNTSSVTAENIQLSVAGFAEHGFTIAPGSTTTQFVGNLAAGQTHTETFHFGSRGDIDTGSYHINFNLRWDGTEELLTDTFRYYVTVFGEDRIITDSASLRIMNISTPTGVYGVGEVAHVSVTLENHGDESARNLRISARPEAGIVPRLASIHTLQTLEVGASHTFDFAFSPTSSANTQFYNVGFLIEYVTGNTASPEGSFEQFVGFSVYNPEDDEAEPDLDLYARSVPRIIVSNYTLDPLIVMANSEFDLFLTFQNTHRDRSIRNIRVNIDALGTVTAPGGGTAAAPGGVFTPVGTSNTFFIDEILPRQESHHHMRMFAVPNADPRNHIITITFEYEDALGNPFTAEENIGVNVQQVSRLELGTPAVAEMVDLHMPIDIQLNVHNTGRVTLYNLRIRIEAEGFDLTGADQVLGNFTSGSFDLYWGRIIPLVGGDHEITIVASYHDAMDVLHEIRESFHVHVMDWGGGDDFPMWEDDWPMWEDDHWMGDNDGDGAGLPTWAWIGGGLTALLGSGGGGFFYLRKRRNKALDLMGED